MKAKILLVEDEITLGETIQLSLLKLGYEIQWAKSITEAKNVLKDFKPKIILLDRMLPDGDGLDLCEKIRAESFQGGVLLLTAKGDTSDRVDGLVKGADDYLSKPFSFQELEARINAVLRRIPESIFNSTQTLWQYDLKNLKIYGPNGWINLTPLEYKLTRYLISSKDSIVSRDELLKKVWGFTLLPKTRTVDLFLGKIRKYFEADPENPKHFLTVRGAGYRFSP